MEGRRGGLEGCQLPYHHCPIKVDRFWTKEIRWFKGNKEHLYFHPVCLCSNGQGTSCNKQKFMEDLQDAVNEISASDVMLLLGDLNARVGSANGSNDVWRGVRGTHGVGRCNEAGEKLLEFCSLNQLTIMNTWFEKKRHHLTTWKHPATK